MKRIIFLFLLICLSKTSTYAQHRYVKIGELVPSVSFEVSHYPFPKASIEDFRGKYILLDLWGVHCGGCIEMMPYVQRLQAQYKNKLQVIMVTKNTKAEVVKLAQHSENVRNDRLPSVMGDSAFAGLFDYRWLPTYVWIDPNGIIRYITGGEAVTDSNVHAFVSGERLLVKEKKDIWIDDNDPALVAWYPYTQKIGIYSYLAPRAEYSSAGGSARGTNQQGNIWHIRDDGAFMKDLYKTAYQMKSMWASSERVILHIKDSALFAPKDTTGNDQRFVYELISNNNAPTAKVYRQMQSELDLFCNARSSLQKKELTCYVLKKLPGSDVHLHAKDTTQRPNGDEDSKLGTYNATNVRWMWVWSEISYALYAPHQLLDESGIDRQMKVDFKFNRKHWNNIPLLNEELKPYGLYVSVEKRLLDCIVIEDDKP
ncbi:MAG: TlpA disulfide reductase family protein [Arachidicoccus sp.]|nr:TlpA disulfide reductase family protein [Arachidicoccus sp.]